MWLNILGLEKFPRDKNASEITWRLWRGRGGQQQIHNWSFHTWNHRLLGFIRLYFSISCICIFSICSKILLIHTNFFWGKDRLAMNFFPFVVRCCWFLDFFYWCCWFYDFFILFVFLMLLVLRFFFSCIAFT